MNIKITGRIAEITQAETFSTANGTFTYSDMVIQTPGYNGTFDIIVVKVNCEKINIQQFAAGMNVEIDANLKSTKKQTKDGRSFYDTRATAWKIQQVPPQQQMQQQVQYAQNSQQMQYAQQPVQQPMQQQMQQPIQQQGWQQQGGKLPF